MSLDNPKQTANIIKILNTQRIKNISQETLPSHWISITNKCFEIQVKGQRYPTRLTIDIVGGELKPKLSQKNKYGPDTEIPCKLNKDGDIKFNTLAAGTLIIRPLAVEETKDETRILFQSSIMSPDRSSIVLTIIPR